MAQTVGFPCAIATRMVLDKEIQRKGMVLPFTKDIYKPMLDRWVSILLAQLSIAIKMSISKFLLM